MVSITIANEILKLDYIEVVRDVLNSSTVLNHRLEKDFESVQGDQVYIGLNTSRNNSFASRPQNSTAANLLPTAQTQGYAATWFDIPEMYGRFEVHEKDIKASRNSKGALIRVLDTEMRHLIRDAKVQMNRMNFGDGSAVIAKVASEAWPTLTLDKEYTGDAANTRETYYDIRFMEPGLEVEAGSAKTAEDTGMQGFVESTAAGAAPTVTFVSTTSTQGTVAANDYLAVAGSWGSDQMGLLGIVDDGSVSGRRFFTTLQNIDRSAAANNFWNANVLTNPAGAGTLRDVSLDLLQEAVDTAEIQGDGEVSAFITTYGIRRKILALLVADKRFVAPYEMDLDGGFRALSYNGIPIIPDRHAPEHMIFGLDEPTIRFYQMSDFEWMEEDGAVLSRVAGKPMYEATLFLYREMATTDPKNNVRIDDVNDQDAL